MKNKNRVNRLVISLLIVCLSIGIYTGCGSTVFEKSEINTPDNTEETGNANVQDTGDQSIETPDESEEEPESDQDKYVRLYKENAMLKAEFEEVRALYLDNRWNSNSTNDYDYDHMSVPQSDKLPEAIDEDWSFDSISTPKTIEEIRESLPDMNSIQVPDIDETDLSEKIKIYEHDNAEYERVINEMIAEIQLKYF